MARSYICVGGPKDGQRIAVRDGCAFFRVALLPPLLVSHPDNERINVDYVEYRQTTFFTGENENITMWAPAHQSPRTTMELLLSCYETRRVP